MIFDFSNRDIGQIAERQAIEHLMSVNYQIIARNFRCKMGEIDIIAQSPCNEWVFVEVKYRTRDDFGGSLQALTINQQQRIRNAALHWLQSNDPDYRKQCRFDVIAISALANRQKRLQLNWLEGAF